MNENSFIQMGAEPPNHSNIDTPTPILDKYPESDAHIRKSFLQNGSKCFGFFLQMDASWMEGWWCKKRKCHTQNSMGWMRPRPGNLATNRMEGIDEGGDDKDFLLEEIRRSPPVEVGKLMPLVTGFIYLRWCSISSIRLFDTMIYSEMINLLIWLDVTCVVPMIWLG